MCSRQHCDIVQLHPISKVLFKENMLQKVALVRHIV